MSILPSPSAGHEYAERSHNGQSYITTGLFPIGSPSHRREHLWCLPHQVLLELDSASETTVDPFTLSSGWLIRHV